MPQLLAMHDGKPAREAAVYTANNPGDHRIYWGGKIVLTGSYIDERASFSLWQLSKYVEAR